MNTVLSFTEIYELQIGSRGDRVEVALMEFDGGLIFEFVHGRTRDVHIGDRVLGQNCPVARNDTDPVPAIGFENGGILRVVLMMAGIVYRPI